MRALLFFKYCFLLLLVTFAINMPKAYAFRFVVYGDCRAPRGDPAVINRPILGAINTQIANLKPRPDFVLFLGDCVNRGWAPNYAHNNLLDWQHFMKQYLGKIPIYTAAGNNELYGNTGWTEYPLQTEYQDTFDYLPSNGPRHYKKLAYCLEHGKETERTLFMVLDSFGFYEQEGALTNFDNGYDAEQIHWFAKKAQKSKARYKFVFSHGPAFSVEGWPVHSSANQIWDLMTKNHFDSFYCSHEHIFSRWPITKKVYANAKKSITQTIVGSAGSALDDPALVKVDFHEAHIYSGFTFIVVDVEEHKMVQKSYALVQQGTHFTTRLIDKFVIKK